MGQIVRWLPVIERLVAILDRSKKSCNHASGEKDVKRSDGLNWIGAVAPIRTSQVSISHAP